MTDNVVFIEAAKVFGKGKIVVPKDVRGLLRVVDGDRIVFYQDSEGKVFVEGAPKPKKKLGTY